MEKKKKSCSEILIYIYIIGGIFAMLTMPPNFTKGGSSNSKQKACYSNIRVIQGAVEMYNMDASELMSELNIDYLTNGHYLKVKPDHPDKPCSYQGSKLEDDGSVYCTFHGDIQGITPGSYDGIDYMTFGDRVNKFFKSFFESLPYGIFWPVMLLMIILSIK